MCRRQLLVWHNWCFLENPGLFPGLRTCHTPGQPQKLGATLLEPEQPWSNPNQPGNTERLKPFGEIKAKERGRTLDVLNAVRRLCEVGTAGSAVRAPSGRKIPAALPPGTSQRDVPTYTFTTADAYSFTGELEKLHPDNRHVKDKIRQQLQVLRDAGLLIQLGRGEWRLPGTALRQPVCGI